MARVTSVHQFQLKPGIQPEDFEQAMREEIAKAFDLRGAELYLTKGERGEQVGDYLIMWEFYDSETTPEFSVRVCDAAALCGWQRCLLPG